MLFVKLGAFPTSNGTKPFGAESLRAVICHVKPAGSNKLIPWKAASQHQASNREQRILLVDVRFNRYMDNLPHWLYQTAERSTQLFHEFSTNKATYFSPFEETIDSMICKTIQGDLSKFCMHDIAPTEYDMYSMHEP